jgi:DNA replication and repair protein RecF
VTTRLSVAGLRLADFRNHHSVDLRLDARPVCIYGANGAGKTNLLEALTCLAPGRGLRGGDLMELARVEGAETRPRPWAVSADIEHDGERITLGAGAERTPEGGVRRIARMDGRPATASELARAAPMLWVTPAMDRLFAGPPGDRRRFFDRLTLSRAPEHGQSAAAYERAMRERQRLLNEGRPDPSWLGALEREMAAHGAALAAARADTCAALADTIAHQAEGAFPKAIVALEGALETAFSGGRPSAEIEDEFLQLLRSMRGRDAGAGRTLDGPHRSDLKVTHAAKQMPADLCSTGEQKALLLGLVLAHARALADDPGAGPALLLLDEAAAHLDAARRAGLYDALAEAPGQSWLTGTDESLFAAFAGRAQRFAMSAEGPRPA